MQFANIRNFETTQRKLGIAKLQTNFERGIQFRNRAPQFRNFGIDAGETRVQMMSAGDTKINYQRHCFEAFCKEHYANRNNKTISKDKGQKMVRLLKNIPIAVNYS